MANQTAQTAHQTILQHSNPENGTTCYSHAGRIITPFLAAVAIPEKAHSTTNCCWHPLGFYPGKQTALTACLAFIDTLPPEIANYAAFTAMKVRAAGINGFYDRLLARLPQTSR